MKVKFIIEKVSNMIFISSDSDVIFESWDESEFTERKLKNAMKRLSKNNLGNVEFVRAF